MKLLVRIIRQLRVILDIFSFSKYKTYNEKKFTFNICNFRHAYTLFLCYFYGNVFCRKLTEFLYTPIYFISY